jgi:hypothetical protein
MGNPFMTSETSELAIYSHLLYTYMNFSEIFGQHVHPLSQYFSTLLLPIRVKLNPIRIT